MITTGVGKAAALSARGNDTLFHLGCNRMNDLPCQLGDMDTVKWVEFLFCFVMSVFSALSIVIGTGVN